MGALGLFVVGVEQRLVQRFIGLPMVVGKDLQVELGDFDLGCGLAVEGRRVYAVAERVGPGLRLLLADLLGAAGVVELAGYVLEVGLLVTPHLRNVVLFQLGAGGGMAELLPLLLPQSSVEVLATPIGTWFSSSALASCSSSCLILRCSAESY